MATHREGELRPVRRALVSVYDKTGVVELAAGLDQLGVVIISTGTTAGTIAAAGVPVTEVAEVTGFPECLDGRVKTLHPRVHAAILADRDKPPHMAELESLAIPPIDLVICNLYPFQETMAAGGTNAEIVEMIDIGGPTLLRAAAKNHAAVGIVVDPDDYGRLLVELRSTGGLNEETRHLLAAKAFQHTAAYDAAIAAWFQRDEPFPNQLGPVYHRERTLRYGENPHQRAAYYLDVAGGRWGLSSAVQHHGKELSYNNLLDADAAWAMVGDFDEPCVAIVKHTNPAGLALAHKGRDGREGDLASAYERAVTGDPVSAFGGIVAANRSIDRAVAERIAEVFSEVVVAPGYSEDALEVLRRKKNLRLLEITRPTLTVLREDPAGGTAAEPGGRGLAAGGAPPLVMRSVQGGLLVQDADIERETVEAWKVAGAVTPDEATFSDLRFAWQVCKHVKSNAIVLAKDRQVVGVGAGQMSRVDAVRLAVQKSAGRAAGAVLAGDAFFPFRDGPDAAAAAGVTAIVQPGGSLRDAEVVAAADERGIAMIFTGRRHFRH
ncbi:MAG: bifunctional phosphoribosylaminoimidazolecarboxamide formyltransferase/IMP cyclohydrolase [Actinomycetota bacterium]|nr:bifunctional phosphoribosylaminoimidazolecarboxamide formyltransferase/IMP cyclohydrolase [Actinomycetota bacterium]